MSASSSARVPGLDSLRAVAVAVVFGYHAGVPGVPGGFLGVTLFFVISGYLITRLILEEVEVRGTFNLVGFWVRRVRRLLPAAYLVVLSSLVWAVLVAPALLPRLRGDSAAALLYLSNWWMIFHQVSYFESFGLPSPLAHLWTLAIEEQFYLVWPVVLIALIVLVRRKALIVTILSVAVALSSTLMAVDYRPNLDPSRSYLGTDCRVGELLIGALLAVALHLVSAKQPMLTARWADRILNSHVAIGLVVVSAGTLAVLVATLSEYSPFAYRGGILLAAVASTGLVLGLQGAAWARPSAWMDRSVVGSVGRRSYSIYLWHFPVLVAFSTPLNFGIFAPARTASVLVVTLVLAEASYRWVETPFRRHGMLATMRSAFAWVRSLSVVPGHAAVMLALAPVALAGLALTGVRDPEPAFHGPEAIVEGVRPAASNPGRVPRAKPSPSPTAAPRRMLGADTVAIGDSLMIDIAAQLRVRAPGITINAEVGRQPWTGLTIADSYTQFDRAGGNYLLGIGTNGAIDAASLRQFCATHAQARVFLITPRVNRPWESTSVNAIRSAAQECSNVRVVDFHDAARGHTGYFGPDGVHLTPAGVARMVDLIVAAARR